jgi:Nucleoside-diphosphate-sugar pyrophosphorylase involved in lipopolysaccharide biosynthesis/translation initiation factor 2B, gamma/epsilon subunits (eIF-2Bgamma/eIF-2Bepsilon)
MKVVLFCGGLGTRLREYSETIPKPMVTIGYRPILWHVMRYYAHYGHKEFILCLGYKADVIKSYFLGYNESISNDFILAEGGKLQLLNSDIQDWRITFIDTGLNSNIGQRLKAIEKYLAGEEVFLANYTDGVSDLPLPKIIEYLKQHDKIGCFVGVNPRSSFHRISYDEGGLVHDIGPMSESGMRVNGGFFVFKKKIFDYIKDGEELVEEPFKRLIAEKQLVTYPYDGFWACIDTFKDFRLFEEMYARGQTPWEVWKTFPR